MGNVHVSKQGDLELKAFAGSVGVFGVVTEILVQMTPPTNTQLITVVKDDKKMMDKINALLKVCVWGRWGGGSGYRWCVTRCTVYGGDTAGDVHLHAIVLFSMGCWAASNHQWYGQEAFVHICLGWVLGVGLTGV